MTGADLVEIDDAVRRAWDEFRIQPTELWISGRQLKLLRRALRRVWEREVARGYPFHPLDLESL